MILAAQMKIDSCCWSKQLDAFFRWICEVLLAAGTCLRMPVNNVWEQAATCSLAFYHAVVLLQNHQPV